MKKCPNCSLVHEATGWQCPGCAFVPPAHAGIPLLAPALAHGGAGFDPELFSVLAATEEANFWFCARNRLILWALRRYFPVMQRFLEVGCGTGFVLSGVAKAFPAASLAGSEIFVEGLPFAAGRVSGAELLQLDARRLPYYREFDVIGAFDVLEHIEDDKLVLREIHDALRAGGGVVLTVPQHPWLWSDEDVVAHHVRRYRPGELRDKLRATGFLVELDTSFVSLLLPLMWASRHARRFGSRPSSKPVRGLVLPKPLNVLLEWVMNLERHAIRLGVRFPFGGSRLIVARRGTTTS